MQRLPTSFALSLWLGFHAVTGMSELANMAGVTGLMGHALEAPASTGIGSVFVAALTIGTAGVLAASLVLLNSAKAARILRGEWLAFGGVGISSAMVLAALFFGPPFAAIFDRVDLALWSVAISLLALGFDAMLHAPDDKEDEEDELAFRKALLRIDASVPREVRDRTEQGSHAAGDR